MRLPNGTETPLQSAPEDDFRIVEGRGLGKRTGREQVVTPKDAIACTHRVKTTKLGVTHFRTDDHTFPVGPVKSTIEAKKVEVLLSTTSDKR